MFNRRGSALITIHVREVAEAKGLNLSQLQIKSGIPMTSARRYWHGTVGGKLRAEPLRSVDLDVLERLAKALEVNYCELLAESTEAEKLIS
jgi:transcriptional regulator with XRE-family HTH domain